MDFQIDGAASFSGTLTNAQGSINLTGTGQTTLVSTQVESSLNVGGSTLRGSGTVTGNLSLNGGTLSPGVNGSGTMTVTGAVSGSGTWVFDVVDSSTTDLINVTGAGGTLDVSGFTLNLSAPAQASAGDRIVIASYPANTSAGQFSSVSGLGGNWEMDYNTAGEIAIVSTIPEATNIIPLSLAFLPLLSMRNRRSRK